MALATNAVTVNGGAADRKGEYFHREIAVANSGQPVWASVSVTSGSYSDPGGAVVPANNQTLCYDADGNLTSDGVWTYQWDGENRLITMTMTNVSGIPNADRVKLDFMYDYQGRRVRKVVSTWNGSTFVNPVTNNYVYDGWNLIAAFSPPSSVLQSFAWGQDLSGTMDGAGGVGGLLMATISGTNSFPAYDGNGNITALVNAADASVAARYEYSPYGELTRTTGPLAHQNPFRFSTKFWDDESGLVFFGHRFCDPALRRWISRDPNGETNGVHLYQFMKNSPTMMLDPDGNEAYSLGQLAVVGVEADTASELFWATAIGFEKHPFLQRSAIGMTLAGMRICVEINNQLNGKLLKNIGGNAVFAVVGAGGIALQQSLAGAVVSGRLEALAAIGRGAEDLMTGDRPEDELDQAGADFSRDLQKGDTAYADLDAALIGAGVAGDMVNGPENIGQTAVSLTSALLSHDYAAAFSSLPDYMALNAWDMAQSLENGY